MRIISRYIASEFLKTVIFAAIAFLLIYILVDVFEKMDRFIDHKVTGDIISKYYFYQIPYILVLVFPVAMLLASIFSIGQLARRQELIAMKASGISLYRILLPIFILGFLTSILMLVVGELVVPRSNQIMGKVEKQEIDKIPPIDYNYRNNVFYRGTKGRMFYIKNFDGVAGKLSDVVIYEFTKEGRLLKRIDAVEGMWVKEGNPILQSKHGSEGHWIFRSGYVRNFDEKGGEYPFQFEEIRLADLSETPVDFAREEKEPNEMGFFELKKYIDRIKRGGGEAQKEMVDLYLKISFPFANFIIILFGAPLSSNPRRGGAAFGFGLSLLISFLYWGFIQTGRALGHHGTISPLLAAWLANIFFGAIGGILLWKTPK